MKKFGLIGYPLGHSFSKNFFHEKFQSEKIDAEYVNFEIPDINDFPAILTSNPDLEGLNVTIPYKEQVMHYLNNIAPEAISIGAVNVIKIERNKGKIKLTGYNSDVTGFTQSIEPLLEPYHKKALILGTGGASKAVNYGLKQLGLSTLFVSRNHHNDTTITYEELTPEIMDSYKVIVNCTFSFFCKVDKFVLLISNVASVFVSNKLMVACVSSVPKFVSATSFVVNCVISFN